MATPRCILADSAYIYTAEVLINTSATTKIDCGNNDIFGVIMNGSVPILHLILSKFKVDHEVYRFCSDLQLSMTIASLNHCSVLWRSSFALQTIKLVWLKSKTLAVHQERDSSTSIACARHSGLYIHLCVHALMSVPFSIPFYKSFIIAIWHTHR